ncbi:mucin-5AC [Anastrepha obliqua]|uniref:mucin-5AC n=1 Tax=Anastrepha obliqua TaxID=95512 RepID=UPI002409A2F3|nr:mucin-5AC [Anastrepha obliqua]
MEMEVILLVCGCLQLLLLQQSPILVNGESANNATSSVQTALPNNGTNITITKYQIKNTPNVTNALYAEMVLNGTGNNGSTEKMLSRKITKTANEPTPTETQNSTKVDAAVPGHKNSTQVEPKLAMVAPNVIIDVNTLSPNTTESVAAELNVTKSGNTTNVRHQDNTLGKNLVNTTISINLKNTTNQTTTTTLRTPTAKVEGGAQAGDNSMDVRSTNGTIPQIKHTTSTTTTTTTTTTPKPKKPSITFGLGDFPELPGERIVFNKAPESSSSKLPVPNDPVVPPNAQPSQELNSGFNYHSSRDYIVPIMTVLFTIPLAIGVVITTYRRFRDCWSTRHYRRMDFLVDGMYND